MPEIFLTSRQLEVLRLRRKGLSQREIASKLKTTRENVNILEMRAHRNIRKAAATLEVLSKLEIAATLKIPPKTPILRIPLLILKKADEANIRVKMNCIEILREVQLKAEGKIRKKRLLKPLTVIILPDGSLHIR
ncbi:MAG: transcriptional regulator [Candidatus Hecatellales archaeon]|nr:MAG: transcriptional regulator [Candidatus Hecatellales archaeon]